MGRESDWLDEGGRESVKEEGDKRPKRKREGRYLGREIQLILLFYFTHIVTISFIFKLLL